MSEEVIQISQVEFVPSRWIKTINIDNADELKEVLQLESMSNDDLKSYVENNLETVRERLLEERNIDLDDLFDRAAAECIYDDTTDVEYFCHRSKNQDHIDEAEEVQLAVDFSDIRCSSCDGSPNINKDIDNAMRDEIGIRYRDLRGMLICTRCMKSHLAGELFFPDDLSTSGTKAYNEINKTGDWEEVWAKVCKYESGSRKGALLAERVMWMEEIAGYRCHLNSGEVDEERKKKRREHMNMVMGWVKELDAWLEKPYEPLSYA